MAFVAFDNDEAYRAWRSLEVSMSSPVTWLAGLGKRPVLALPDPIVCELADRGIAFTVIDEEKLPQHLAPRGLAYYRHLRHHHPDHLYFNAPLPPALHVAMSCNARDVHVEAVKRIVERYEPVELRTSEITVLAITPDPEPATGPEMLVKVEFVVPRVHQRTVMEELMASGAAGYSRETAIFVESDPDGAPMEE